VGCAGKYYVTEATKLMKELNKLRQEQIAK